MLHPGGPTKSSLVVQVKGCDVTQGMMVMVPQGAKQHSIYQSVVGRERLALVKGASADDHSLVQLHPDAVYHVFGINANVDKIVACFRPVREIVWAQPSPDMLLDALLSGENETGHEALSIECSKAPLPRTVVLQAKAPTHDAIAFMNLARNNSRVTGAVLDSGKAQSAFDLTTLHSYVPAEYRDYNIFKGNCLVYAVCCTYAVGEADEKDRKGFHLGDFLTHRIESCGDLATALDRYATLLDCVTQGTKDPTPFYTTTFSRVLQVLRSDNTKTGVKMYPVNLVKDVVDTMMLEFCQAARQARLEGSALSWTSSSDAMVQDYFSKVAVLDLDELARSLLLHTAMRERDTRSSREVRAGRGVKLVRKPLPSHVVSNPIEAYAKGEGVGRQVCMFHLEQQLDPSSRGCITKNCPRVHDTFSSEKASALIDALTKTEMKGGLLKVRDNLVTKLSKFGK